MDITDPRFTQLIRLNQKITVTSPESDEYKELLEQVYNLALELYLEYEDDELLIISKFHE